MSTIAEARSKRFRAMELCAEGYSYDSIAFQIGYANRGAAYRAVTKAVGDREVQTVESFRCSELDRLDACQKALWGRAMDGDLGAILAILAISRERVRFYALADQQPTASTRTRVKRTRALQLRAQGYNYDQIAQEVGFTHRASAHRAVSRALATSQVEDIEELRVLELMRLDKLYSVVWPAISAWRSTSSKGRVGDQCPAPTGARPPQPKVQEERTL